MLDKVKVVTQFMLGKGKVDLCLLCKVKVVTQVC